MLWASHKLTTQFCCEHRHLGYTTSPNTSCRRPYKWRCNRCVLLVNGACDLHCWVHRFGINVKQRTIISCCGGRVAIFKICKVEFMWDHLRIVNFSNAQCWGVPITLCSAMRKYVTEDVQNFGSAGKYAILTILRCEQNTMLRWRERLYLNIMCLATNFTIRGIGSWDRGIIPRSWGIILSGLGILGFLIWLMLKKANVKICSFR